MRISILGVGSMGSVAAASLASTDAEVHLHVRGERGAARMLEGLRIQGEKSMRVEPTRFMFSCEEMPAEDRLTHGSDIVLLACKSYDVANLAKKAAAFLKPDGLVMALSNGLGHVETLCRIHGPERVVAMITTHGAYSQEDGSVVWAGQGEIGMASPPLGPQPTGMKGLLALFEEANLNPKLHENASELIWEKVLLNLAINPIAALAGLKNGELLASELFNASMMVYREAVLVATMRGLSLSDEFTFETRLRTVLEKTGENTCSMLQDVKAGRITEIGALNQAIVEMAESSGIAVPVNQMLTALVRACHP